ncbi:MAG TPA: PrsW family glutamic-type intramembrane protease [Ktedonobacteraceae bacterium]|nr:PrsW family glutamic-type intramembrane protease [Ktedonobacteraceae bacterium]
MSSEQREPAQDNQRQRPTSELWGAWEQPDDTQPQQPALRPQFQRPPVPGGSQFNPADPQFTHREHVTGALPSHPSEAPLFRPTNAPFPGYQNSVQGQANLAPGAGYPPPQGQRPGYPPVPGPSPMPPPSQGQGQGYPPQRAGYPAYPGNPQYPFYQGYGPYAPPSGYNGYVPYPPYPPAGYYPYAPYAWQQPEPKRDSYLLGVGIAALVGSSLLLLAGLGCLGLLALFSIAPKQNLSASSIFASVVLFIAFAITGVVGGIAGLYHSIRQVFLRKPSRDFSLPRFWIFVILYLIVVGIGFLLHTQKQDVTYPALTVVLILLAGLFPALAVVALGVRRLHFPGSAAWPTTWRRFTLALLCGATLSIIIAGALELVAGVLLVHGQTANPLICADQPNAPGCQNPGVYTLLLIMIAVIAPIVEETVKPIGALVLMGRIRSAAEAFTLGLACGIGFNLIETTGYISSGYNDWLSVALIRTGSGLLHGFGAAMVTLGWYYLIHGKNRRFLLAFLCWLYAVLQHALWNGSWGLVLIPGPIGDYFNNANVTVGPYPIPAYEIINIVEALFMLAFFIYMTGRLRTRTPALPSPGEDQAASESGQKETVRA